ncbi:MAG: histidine phosphatase family protein [Abditibacteriota bacterium]|nr:histidine phosphatase family protein [Abditibacteriota bacterium]
MTIYLIRHGATEANLRRCFLGSTDQSLTPESIRELKGRSYPPAGAVAVSPMTRCRETADIIYGSNYKVYPDLREIDFGEFDNKNHEELLREHHFYQTWLDSGGALTPPGGEPAGDFRRRTCRCFLQIIAETRQFPLAIVAHGGTIKALTDEYLDNDAGKEFYFWSVKNGGGIVCEWDGERLRMVGRLFD